MTPIADSRTSARLYAPLRRVQNGVTGWVMRLTARERLLVGAMALVACVLAPIKAFDLAQSAEGRLVDAQTQLETARQSAGGESAAVNRQIDKQLKDVQRWSWSTSSLTVAQVMLEQQMSVLAGEAHMANVTITSVDDVESVGPLRFARLDISAAFDWLTLTAFLKALADSRKGFVLASVSVEGEAPSKVRILLDVPLTVSGDPKSRNDHPKYRDGLDRGYEDRTPNQSFSGQVVGERTFGDHNLVVNKR